MTEICFICKGPNDTSEQICSRCSKQWVRNPVGLDLATGRPLTVRHPFSWWLRAEDLIVAAQVLIEDWRRARAVYFRDLPDMTPAAVDGGKPMQTGHAWRRWLRALFSSSSSTLPPGSTVQLTSEQKDAHGRLRVIAVAEMLIGMAFECAAKAIIIGADQSIVDDKPRWDALTRNHDLVRYFEQTPLGKTLTPTERGLLNRLREAIEWRGRYPGSKKEPDVHMQVSSDEDFIGWEDLWRRVYGHFPFTPWSPPS